MSLPVWVLIFSMFVAGEAVPFKKKVVATTDETLCQLVRESLIEKFEAANDPRVRVEFGKCFKTVKPKGAKI